MRCSIKGLLDVTVTAARSLFTGLRLMTGTCTIADSDITMIPDHAFSYPTAVTDRRYFPSGILSNI
jgi:hypothetical protein